MKGYGQFCPVAQTMEIVGERWSLLVVRELLCGSRRFSDIQKGVPLMSRSVLAKRLRDLCDAGVIEHTAGEYRLTEAGEELRPIVLELGNWGMRWARRELRNADVDVALLVWDMQRRVDTGAIPAQHVMIELEFRGAPRGKGRFFLHLKGDEVELCLTNPGHDVDLRVISTPRAMGAIWLGDLSFATALRDGEVTLEGPSALTHAFPSWLQLSVFADAPRAR